MYYQRGTYPSDKSGSKHKKNSTGRAQSHSENLKMLTNGVSKRKMPIKKNFHFFEKKTSSNFHEIFFSDFLNQNDAQRCFEAQNANRKKDLSNFQKN